MINIFGEIIKNMSFKRKLMLYYIFLISIPMAIISMVYFKGSSSIIKKGARENTYEILKKNNEIIDIKLNAIHDSVSNLLLDEDLFEIFNNELPKNDLKLLKLNRKINTTVDKYLSVYPQIFSIFLVTDQFQFGSDDVTVAKRAFFKETRMYDQAVQSKGRLSWVSTYHVNDEYDLGELKPLGDCYPYLFAAVQKLNLTKISSSMKSMNPEREKPILVINIKLDIFKERFDDAIKTEGYQYLIIDDEGNVINGKDNKLIGKNYEFEFLDIIKEKNSGSEYITISGEKYLLCYDRLKSCGWNSVMLIPANEILKKLYSIKNYVILFQGVIITLIAIVLAVYISNSMAKPIRTLIYGIRKMGDGDLKVKLPVEREDEFGEVIHNFNHMNEKIHILIEENYASELRLKEGEIMALKNQLNPHFLSNTLNVINWMAIENNEEEISRMIVTLSKMLQYTLRNKGELIEFQWDLEWMKSYEYIMKVRYEDKFNIIYDIEKLILDEKVPMMFLQPFIENSIIHGFNKIYEGGEIRIHAKLEGEYICFSLVDNGCGYDTTEIKFGDENIRTNIGIKNTIERLNLIYGGRAEINIYSEIDIGTQIEVRLPKERIDYVKNVH